MAETPVATYDYTGTGALSGNWTVQLNTVARENNRGSGNTSKTCMADWTGDSFDNDQYSQGEMLNLSSYTLYIMLGVRGAANGSNWDGYAVTTDGVNSTTEHNGILEYINVADAGDGTFLTDHANGGTNGDLCKITVDGTSIEQWYSSDGGSSWGTAVSSTTDATLTAGDAGGGVYGDNEGIDNWEGGNIGAAAAAAYAAAYRQYYESVVTA